MEKIAKEEVREVLEEALPAIDWVKGRRLFTDRIMDSMSLVSAVMELSLAFDVSFDLDALSPENMDDLEAVTETVNRLRGQ